MFAWLYRKTIVMIELMQLYSELESLPDIIPRIEQMFLVAQFSASPAMM